ncbi:MAG: TraR/DksA C4-type zinc finger protein [Thermodesulfobacteriota bacterium]
MEGPERAKIKERIVAEIEESKAKVAALHELSRPIAPDNAVGRLSRMEAITTKGINEAALSNAKRKLARLQHALTQVDDPDFGVCFECGEPIPIGRILLMPESTMCVQCAEEHEA